MIQQPIHTMPVKSFDEYLQHCVNLYNRYHNVDSAPRTLKDDVRSYYDDYLQMTTEFNQRVKHAEEREYLKTLKTVEDKILRGNFGKGYNTKRPKTDFNVFFQMEAFRSYHLKVEDKQRLHQIYLQKYHELQAVANQNRQLRFKEAKQRIYENYLLNIQHDSKLVEPNTIRNFVHTHFPQVDDQFNSLYNYYYTEFAKILKKKQEEWNAPIPKMLDDDETLRYPFKTKFGKFKKLHNIDQDRFPRPDKDYKPKRLKEKLQRPYFAYYPHSWEIDHIQHGRTITYMFAININTRYLYVIHVANKKTQQSRIAIEKIIQMEQEQFNKPVKSIRADGDRGFTSLQQWLENKGIKTYFQSSPFTYHNKIVDAAIRTMRNALGVHSEDYWDGHHDKIIQQLVDYYNNTYHNSIKMTPIEMHTDIEKEWEYIRDKTEELRDIKKKQFENGLYNYKKGDKLLVHLDYSKTSQRFEKRRKQFDRLATFIEYRHGNCVVQLDHGSVIEVPIYFTKRV